MIKERLEQMHRDFTLHSGREFSDEKKMLVREEILSFMNAHPISSGEEILKEHLSENKDVAFDIFFFTKMKLVGVTLIITLTLGASVSYAAQDSLPGDSLYSIKTNVNENLRGWFAQSPKQEAKLHVEFAEERIKETEKLMAKGGIKPEIATQLEENFKVQARAVDVSISKLTSENKHEDALEVSSQFESSLKAHESVLSGLNEEHEGTTTVSSLVGSVEEEIDANQETRTQVEKKIKEDDSINKETARTKMQLAKGKIAEVSTLIEQLQEMKLIKRTKNEGEVKLNRAQKSYDTGRGRYLRDLYSDSFVYFEKAKQQAEEAKTYLAVSIDLEAQRKKQEEAKNADITPIPSTSATTTPVQNATSSPSGVIATTTSFSGSSASTTTLTVEVKATTTLKTDTSSF